MGQVRSQTLQLVHFSGKMWALSFSITIASDAHISTQAPQPMQSSVFTIGVFIMQINYC
jgi:hypothetical protein